MNDHDDRIRRLSADYNEPDAEVDPATRDALWERIQAARAKTETGRTVRTARRVGPRGRTMLQGAVAVAAVLLLGVMIGRWSMPDAPAPAGTSTIAEAPVGPDARDASDPSTARRLYARDYLLRTETLLAEFRAAAMTPDASSGMPNSPWAGSLLQETRLLLDSPVADSPELTRLLRDLELILAEIVQLTESADERERHEIRQSLEDRGVMLRLRNAVPAKVGTRGA